MRPATASRTRIAPTPSGLLHAGNAINFLLIEQVARALDASVLLRIDDLDHARVRPGYVQDVFDSLHWLGIVYDEGPRQPRDLEAQWSQSHRLPRYTELLDRLRDTGVLYGCTCTRSHSRGQDGRYPGTCREKGIDLNDPSAAWRINVPAGTTVTMLDLRGEGKRLDVAGTIGDVVLRQRPLQGTPAMPAYQIASLADDVDQAVNVIVRGNDLLPSTAMQLHLAQVLGLDAFTQVRFQHHHLVLDAQGNKLSKSGGAASLKAMRERGEMPAQLREQAVELFNRCF